MTAVQRDEAWLSSATPAEIAAAQSAGELANLLAGVPAPVDPAAAQAALHGQVLAGEARAMSPDEVAAAMNAGRLDYLLGRPVAPGHG